jgi:hypothetical protein
MDLFVRRLVQRLLDPRQPLSRNRHFHTFESAEGKLALRITRRLKSLQRDVAAALAEGVVPQVAPRAEQDGGVRIELTLERLKGTRRTWLAGDEFALLCTLPGMEPLDAQGTEGRRRRAAGER